ncbi:MAG: hypothetical protein SCARUB_05242 [Candidatus Scalindua rubra]|uniref:Uncharacterized protein n=1 Tax=Candidatus Scalindua rubra TaxID=1872076 RepID=A0A1E3X259_9BACT|nr:MAG: hypothetical protein SCARUB_05242 [Candidatus Scalindua rubra]
MLEDEKPELILQNPHHERTKKVSTGSAHKLEGFSPGVDAKRT